MGACAMVQVPRPPPPPPNQRAITPGIRPGAVGGGIAGPGMFYPVTFTGPTPRVLYPPSSVRATAVPFYPSSPQVYYEQAVGVAKRSPDQVDPVYSIIGPPM